MTCYSKPTFPLLKLPYLPFDLIIKQMEIGEIILMSICSKRVSYLVKIGKHQLNDVLIHVKTGYLRIEVGRTSEDYCDFEFNSTENGGEVPKGCVSLAQWFRNGNSEVLNFTATDSIEDVFSVYKRLSSDFRVKNFFWRIFPEDRNLKRFISTLDFDICSRLYVIGGKIDNDTLSFLIDRLKFKNRLTITSEISSDFKHSRALDLAGIDCKDARWVTLNDLKKIRNGSYVDLIGRTNFDNNDINELIKYWTECKEMMFTTLSVRLREGVEIDEFGIVKGVISCRSSGTKRSYYLSKKLIQTHSIGSVEFSDGIVTLTTWNFDSQLGYMVPILKLLEQRAGLTINYSELIKKERELNARLESVENEAEKNDLGQEILKVQVEKKNVGSEFYKTVEQLKIRNVTHFDDFLEPSLNLA